MRAKQTQPSPGAAQSHAERAAPGKVLWAMWVALLVLSLFGANELRAWVVRDAWLGSQPWALAISAGAVRGSEALGLAQLYAQGRKLAAAALPAAARPGRSRLGRARSASVRTGARSAPVRPAPVLAAAASRKQDEQAGHAAGPAARATAGAVDLLRLRTHKVLLIGASSMQFYLGAELERLLGTEYQGVEVFRRGKVSTGLARPDLLDWPHELQTLLADFQPDLVVGNFGGNDAQNMLLDDGRVLVYGTPAWNREYRARVRRIIELSQQSHARVALLGMPPMRRSGFSERMRHLNHLTEQEALVQGAVYVSTWDLASDAHGRYRKAITVDGERGLMRLADGKHYSRLGAIHVARGVVERLEQSFVLVPKDDTLAVALPHRLVSSVLGREVPYLAYVPQAAARGERRLPVLFLLHGVDSSFADWPRHAHRLLQELSNEHGLIVVVPDGSPDGWYIDSPRLPKHRYASWLIDELLPDVDAWLPTNGRRGIAGQSAGGHGALTLALTHPGLFQSASSMSGVLDLTAASDRPALVRALGRYADNPKLWQSRSARHIVARDPDAARRLPMLITVGNADRWAPANRAFARELDALGVDHVFQESAGGHDWAYWVSELPRHLAWHASVLNQGSAAD